MAISHLLLVYEIKNKEIRNSSSQCKSSTYWFHSFLLNKLYNMLHFCQSVHVVSTGIAQAADFHQISSIWEGVFPFQEYAGHAPFLDCRDKLKYEMKLVRGLVNCSTYDGAITAVLLKIKIYLPFPNTAPSMVPLSNPNAQFWNNTNNSYSIKVVPNGNNNNYFLTKFQT